MSKTLETILNEVNEEIDEILVVLGIRLTPTNRDELPYMMQTLGFLKVLQRGGDLKKHLRLLDKISKQRQGYYPKETGKEYIESQESGYWNYVNNPLER